MLLALALMTQIPPLPPLPSKNQLEWHKLEYHAFVHFGPNTFTDKEWGEGKEDPNLFNPTALDCRQWVRTFKEAGMKQVIITAKHHDGFCLWPTKYSKHTVAQSRWRDGKGDVLQELRKACNEYGMKMGVYLSPWDRNHPLYGTPEYNQVFADMLKEVLTKYGPIYEVWFDGANGEGPNGKKQVYDWPLFNDTVAKYAPKAVIFSDGGPGVRWVGNEDGVASETNWSMLQRDRFYPGAPFASELGEGHENGTHWVPAECDVSIRPGWFYHAEQDTKVKTPAQLFDLYLKSVGRNGSLLLNVPPDRRGLIHEADVAALMGFKKLRDGAFRKNLLKGPRSLADGKLSTYVSLDSPLEVECSSGGRWISLSEPVQLGQRVKAFVVEGLQDGRWVEVAKGTTIGVKRILPLGEPATQIRVTVSSTRWPAALAELAVY